MAQLSNNLHHRSKIKGKDVEKKLKQEFRIQTLSDHSVLCYYLSHILEFYDPVCAEITPKPGHIATQTCRFWSFFGSRDRGWIQ